MSKKEFEQHMKRVKNLAKSTKKKSVESTQKDRKKIGPSSKTPISKMSWFKNLKK